MKYKIKVKRDFGAGPGFWLPGDPGPGCVGTENYRFVKTGFVVTDGFINIMPGATWFRTIPQAMHGLKRWIECGQDPVAWWNGNDAKS